MVPVLWVKRAVAVLLLPGCWVVTAALFEVFRSSGSADLWHSREVWLFSAGFLLWVAAYFLSPRPTGLYVVGHEVTHALFIRMFGGRVGRIHASREGGYVLTNRTNFLISLAPYFIPFWSLVSLSLLALGGLLVDIPDGVLFVAAGLTWSFHLTFTLSMIAKEQPDLDENGRFFSLTFLYLANALIVSAMLVIASPRVSLRAFATAGLDESRRLLRSAALVLHLPAGEEAP